MTGIAPCPVCGGATHVFYALRRLERRALRCDACCFTWIDPPLRQPESEYQAHYEEQNRGARAQIDQAKYALHLRHIREAIDIESAPSRRLLEIGSSHGVLLELFAGLGFHAEGIELSRAGVESSRARGLRLHATTLEAFESPEPFGIVVSTHVLEHLRDVHGYFDKCARLLLPAGLAIVLTPNGDALLFRLLRRFWAGATPNEHNLFLTRRAVHALAEQHGFEVVALRTTGRFWSTTHGILAEGYRTLRRQGVSPPLARGAPAALAPPRLRDRMIPLIGKIELPFLTLLHKLLAPFRLSDELLVVLRRKAPGPSP